MRDVVKTSEPIKAWEAPEPYRRTFRLLFERDITPTRNIAAGTVTFPPGREKPNQDTHDHAEEIYYVVRGRGKFELGDRVVELEPGTAIYVPPGVGHRAINTGDEELELYFVTSPSVFGPVGGYEDFVEGWKKLR